MKGVVLTLCGSVLCLLWALSPLSGQTIPLYGYDCATLWDPTCAGIGGGDCDAPWINCSGQLPTLLTCSWCNSTAPIGGTVCYPHSGGTCTATAFNCCPAGTKCSWYQGTCIPSVGFCECKFAVAIGTCDNNTTFYKC